MIYSKICLEIDEHFYKRVFEFNELFDEARNNNDDYLYLIKEFVLKIFLDIRTRFSNCKVIIIYFACLVVMLDHSNDRLVDLVIGIIL